MNDYSLLAQHITAILRAEEPDPEINQLLPDEQLPETILTFAKND